MEFDGIEKEVLLEIAKRLVMSKEELFKLVEDRVDLATFDNIIRSLEEKGYLAKVSPLGSSSYFVTKKGIKLVK
ncbi:MAG: hypothetical protein QW423_00885 [Candidatus Aenigmatarchaeota archaeon]